MNMQVCPCFVHFAHYEKFEYGKPVCGFAVNLLLDNSILTINGCETCQLPSCTTLYV